MYFDWFKDNDGSLILTDGPWGMHWKQYPGERDDRVNPLYFTCKGCRKTTALYMNPDHPRFGESLHTPGCKHSFGTQKEDIINAMLSLQV